MALRLSDLFAVPFIAVMLSVVLLAAGAAFLIWLVRTVTMKNTDTLGGCRWHSST